MEAAQGQAALQKLLKKSTALLNKALVTVNDCASELDGDLEPGGSAIALLTGTAEKILKTAKTLRGFADTSTDAITRRGLNKPASFALPPPDDADSDIEVITGEEELPPPRPQEAEVVKEEEEEVTETPSLEEVEVEEEDGLSPAASPAKTADEAPGAESDADAEVDSDGETAVAADDAPDAEVAEAPVVAEAKASSGSTYATPSASVSTDSSAAPSIAAPFAADTESGDAMDSVDDTAKEDAESSEGFSPDGSGDSSPKLKKSRKNGKAKKVAKIDKSADSSSDDDDLKDLEAAGRLRLKINVSKGEVKSPLKKEEKKARKKDEKKASDSGQDEVEVGAAPSLDSGSDENLDAELPTEDLPPLAPEEDSDDFLTSTVADDDEESVFVSKEKKKKDKSDHLPDVIELDSDEGSPAKKPKSKKLPGYVAIEDDDGSTDDDIKPAKDKKAASKKRKLAIDSDDDFEAEEKDSEEDEEEEEPEAVNSDFDDEVDEEEEPSTSKSSKKSKSAKKKGGDGDGGGKKKKKRVKVADSDEGEGGSGSEAGSGEEGVSPSKRKGAKKIISDDQLADSTKSAGKREKERWKRLDEKQKRFNGLVAAGEGASGGGPVFKEVVLDKDKDTGEVVQVEPVLVKPMKKHQGEGIKFMFDSVFESVDQFRKGDKGGGCILAHCMGLGKTFQCVTFVYTIMTNDVFANGSGKGKPIHTTLILAPVNAILTWQREFRTWLKKAESDVDTVVLNTPNMRERVDIIKHWHSDGGVLIMGYPLLRTLRALVEKPKSSKGVSKRAAEGFASEIKKSLFDPGPDMIVCDEGHMLKNDKAKITQVVENIKTRRRICLTGTPIQNHLEEYFTMVNFVKNGLLGTKKEFKNRFENPIKAGQFLDSTKHAVKTMKQRSYCLNKELSKVVMRRDHIELVQYLPPKLEYIIYVGLTERQSALYKRFIDTAVGDTDAEALKSRKILPDFHQFSRIWLHPYALLQHQRAVDLRRDRLEELEEEAEFIDDEADELLCEDSDEDKKKRKKGKGRYEPDSDSEDEEVMPTERRRTRAIAAEAPEDERDAATPEDIRGWWGDMVSEDDKFNVAISSKLDLLFSIIRKCEEAGDKLLVFSQSLMSLNIIEQLLEYYEETNTWWADEHEVTSRPAGARWGWQRGKDYYRLDGSMNPEQRKKMQEDFNNPINPRARLFLISTRAGSLGIDLIGANRVIIFDCCWNPSHDTQSIFRVFRFGQKKPTYIYRFVAQGTMEEVIFRRQVTKQSIQLRVCDDLQIQRHFQQHDVEELYQYKEYTVPTGEARKNHIQGFKMPEDVLLRDIILDKGEWISKIESHESLLEHKESEALSNDEQKEAWENYEFERERGVTRNIYAANAEPQWFTLAKHLISIPYGPECANNFRTVCTQWIGYGNQYLERLPMEDRGGVISCDNQFFTFLQASMTFAGVVDSYKKMRQLVVLIVFSVERGRMPELSPEATEKLLSRQCSEWTYPAQPRFPASASSPALAGPSGVPGTETEAIRNLMAMRAMHAALGRQGMPVPNADAIINDLIAGPKETVRVTAKK